MSKCRILFLHPRFLTDNPTAKQLERFLYAIKPLCDVTLFTRPGKMYESRKGSVSELKIIPACGKISEWIGSAIEHHAGGLAFVPDVMRWNTNPQMEYAAIHTIIANKANYDCIVSVGYPLSCHLAGVTVGRLCQLPHVAMFYDPWMDNPHRAFHKGRFFLKWDCLLEKRIAHNAKAIIHTNNTLARIWKDKYNKDNVYVLPFAYTQEMMAIRPEIKQVNDLKRITILYAGLSYKERNVQDIILALGLLKTRGNTNLKRLEIRVCGDIYDKDVELTETCGVSANFVFVGMLNYDSLIKEYQKADIFLVVDSPGQKNVHFPSKLMDYFYYRKPILGITPDNGGTAEHLRASKNTVIRNGDIEAIADYLEGILQGKGLESNDTEYYLNFAPEKIASQFMEIVNSL